MNNVILGPGSCSNNMIKCWHKIVKELKVFFMKTCANEHFFGDVGQFTDVICDFIPSLAF